MAAEVLIDTGAILALIDKSDEWHQVCVRALPRLPLPFLTSEAVLTELFHFLDRQRLNNEPAWKFLHTGIISLASIQHAELRHLQRLISRYSDRPMDFADATLVYLAERESIDAIFTVARPDFSIYRIAGKRHFHVFPLERPSGGVKT
jgi:uncharacterized protein